MDRLHLIMFAVNLVFIIVNVYSFLLKAFYVPAAYKEVFGELYPARRALAFLNFLQLVELPYLFMVGRPDALLYANGTALLLYSSYLFVLIKAYFFLEFYSTRKLLYFMHPVFFCWVALLLPLFGVIEFTETYKHIVMIAVMLMTLGYVYFLNRIRRQLTNQIHGIDENEYSNAEDFPVKFARSIKLLPLIVCLLLILNFLINDPICKMIRDIIFIVVSVWFSIYTLNPHRNTKKLPKVLKKKNDPEEVQPTVKYRLTEKYCKEMQDKLIDIIRERKLYLEEHLNMNDLIDIMHTNKNYLSEIIARSEYQSFYRLVNTLRIEYACEVLKNDPTMKLEQVAISSGFSSGSAFSQIFKRVMDVTPKEYISQINSI